MNGLLLNQIVYLCIYVNYNIKNVTVIVHYMEYQRCSAKLKLRLSENSSQACITSQTSKINSKKSAKEKAEPKKDA